MKKIFIAIFLLLSVNAFGTQYFISNAGNDANSGLSTSTSWRTISKVNSTLLMPGDIVSFKGGDSFVGTLNITLSGTSINPITYNSYGTGQAIITGFYTVPSWTNLGSNIWESTVAVSTLSTCNMVSINGVNTAQGRIPNTGYYPYQSHISNTSITSSSLTGTPNFTGAQVVLRPLRDLIDKGTVTAQSAGTLTYSGGIYTPVDGWGFFLQNSALTLDAQNEWYYDPSTKKIRIYSTTSPTNVQVSTLNELVSGFAKNYITFNNINFQGSNADAMHFTGTLPSSGCAHITVTNCSFSFIGRDGFRGDGGNVTYGDIESNTFTDCNNSAIATIEQTDNYFTIKYNTILRSGVIIGARQTQSHAAIGYDGKGGIIQYNNVDSSGYNGIDFIGDSVICQYNFVKNSCLKLDDGAGIYTNGTGSYKNISYNIVLNTFGNNEGTASSTNFPVAGIYLDDNSDSATVIGNSVAYTNGCAYLLHNAHDNLLRLNTGYDARGLGFTRGNLFMQKDGGGGNERANVINSNIFFAKDATQYVWFHYNTVSSADLLLYGTSDSNYFVRQVGGETDVIRNLVGATTTYYSRPGWTTYSSGQDSHSAGTPKPDSTVRFEYNATASPVTVILYYKYVDVRNTAYDLGYVTIPAYSSFVLIQNGGLTVAAPTVNVGADQSGTTSTATLTAAATPASGHTLTYAWTKLSGTAGGSISSLTTLSTGLTGLTTGVRTYRMTVTQDDGQTAFDDIQVTTTISNINPVANAGADQNITAPTSTITLSGSGTDADGTIVSYLWTKSSGGAGVITSNTSASTTVTGLVAGTYIFTLLVTDNSGGTNTDAMTVIVNPAIVFYQNLYINRRNVIFK